jgi:K+-transporting ATPase A subunit
MALGLARIVRSLASIIALVIVAAIVLFILGANPSNGIVSAIHDAGAWLVGPFKNLFSIHNAKVAMAVNWGLAALVYLIVGHFIASLLVRMTPRRRRAVAV